MEIRFNGTVVTEMNCCVLVRRLATSPKIKDFYAIVAQVAITEISTLFALEQM
jgi:hypothetical protein